jgi:hypothetical protein
MLNTRPKIRWLLAFVLVLAWFGRDGGRRLDASSITSLPSTVVQTNQSNAYTTGTQNFSSAVHTAPTIVVANTGALPASGCVNGELAVVTGATLGQQLYENSGVGTCVWTQQLNTGSSSGGGFGGYSSAAAVTFTGTQFFPIVGGGAPSSTETNVDVDSPAASTVTNLFVQLVTDPGAGNSITLTFRKNAADQSVTCVITGSGGGNSKSCNDTTHSFNVSQGDLLTLKSVVGGTIVGTINLTFTFQFGNITATGTVNTGTINQTAAYSANGAAVSGSTNLSIRSFGGGFDGGGSALTSGATQTTYFTVPFACTITAWNITVDTGTITFDIWKVATGTAIPTSGNSITAAALPAISSGTAVHSTTLSGWTTSVAANDIIGVNINTVATATKASLVVQCNATF